MRPAVISQIGVGASEVVPLDYTQSNFLVGVAATLTGTATYSIQHTYDDVLNPSVIPVWFTTSDMLDQTSNRDGAYTSPIRGLRINQTAGTGTVKLTVLQGNSR